MRAGGRHLAERGGWYALTVPKRALRETSLWCLSTLLPRSGPDRACKGVLCYNVDMTGDQVKAILDRVLTWPAERQADVARVVELMEEQDKSDCG